MCSGSAEESATLQRYGQGLVEAPQAPSKFSQTLSSPTAAPPLPDGAGITARSGACSTASAIVDDIFQSRLSPGARWPTLDCEA
jgi:hypothetical protein